MFINIQTCDLIDFLQYPLRCVSYFKVNMSETELPNCLQSVSPLMPTFSSQ